MTSTISRLLLVLVNCAAAFCCPLATAASVEQDTLAKIERLRAVTTGSGAKPVGDYNKQMDEAWKFFDQNKKQVLPILARELDAEIKKAKPSDLVLLDIGSYLSLQEDVSYRATAKRALFALNPSAEIVQWNFQQLFNFTYAFADDPDPKTLQLFDKIFLPANQSVFVPQHAMTLDGTLICVFLYGKYGAESEDHLRRLLADSILRNRVIEILVWIGSPASLPDVKAAIVAPHDYDTFVRVTAFMMAVGGPEGRATMLAIGPTEPDAKAKKYYGEIAQKIKESSFDTASLPLSRLPGYKKLSDEEVRVRLQAMYKNYGKDEETHPMAIVNSGLPKAYLIEVLTKIRSRMLYRLSNEALDDVQITNALINALRYRAK
jgi:hypothetical protein